MAVTVVATSGSASANSYVTLAEFKAYLDTRIPVSPVVAATSDDLKNRAIVMATRVMDGVMCWTGVATSAVQALNWPRTGVFNKNGYAILDTEIPATLKDATSELARQLLLGDFTATTDAEAQGLSEIKAGPVSLKYRDKIEARRIPDAVFTMLVGGWICDDWRNVIEPPEAAATMFFDSYELSEQ